VDAELILVSFMKVSRLALRDFSLMENGGAT